jgi:hypothetical protein
MHPVISDRYSNELILTEEDLPPDIPTINLNGPFIINIGEECSFSANSTDPEEDQIRYGWEWDAEFPSWIPLWWGNYPSIVDEWTILYDSGEIFNIAHSWDEPGIYDVRVKAQDSQGIEKIVSYYTDTNAWSNTIPIIVCSNDEIVDQWQTFHGEIDNDFGNSLGKIAQSFIPTSNILSKIKLKIIYDDFAESYLLNISIRKNLNEENLVKISKIITPEGNNYERIFWLEFAPDELLELTSGETYYIIFECDDDPELGFIEWCYDHQNKQDNYLEGESYYNLGTGWDIFPVNFDFCFVTYATNIQEEAESSLTSQSQAQNDPFSTHTNPQKHP